MGYHYLNPERLGGLFGGGGHSKSKTAGSSTTFSASNIIKSIVTGTIRPKYPGISMKEEMDEKINALLSEMEPQIADESNLVPTRDPTVTFDELQPGLIGPSSSDSNSDSVSETSS